MIIKNWGEYARLWQADNSWVPIEDLTVSPNDRQSYLQNLGDEWGAKASVDQFVADFVSPHVSKSSKVMELGCGGGRIARRVASHCQLLVCIDIEIDMLALCRRATQGLGNVGLLLCTSQGLNIPIRTQSLDFVYSFDTFVHLDQRVVYKYLVECARVLRPGCRAAVHVASHETEEGWNHFIQSIESGESTGDFGSFEYIDSRAFLRMACKLGFECIGTSLQKSGNVYYDRDLVFLLQR
jgi:ubiquinone/menaquinone biosynthesis C-methylase UbiE